MISHVRIGYGAAALIVVGALAVTATSASNSASMPAATPGDAAAANLVVNTTTVPRNRQQARRASSYRIGGQNGPRVLVGATRTRGFTDFQTFTVAPPAGRQVFQGFATTSRGNAGVFGILRTQVVGGRYVVNVSYPGDQGTPGRLILRVQTLPTGG